MAVHFTNLELQAKLERWASETGLSPDELVENVMTGYFAELTETGETLDGRYDELKSGKISLIPAEEVAARLRQRSSAVRLRHS